MALLSTTRSYADGEVLLAQDLDAFLDDIEIFLNVTRLSDDNIQNESITGSTKLINGSVTTAKIANDAITTAKILNDAVTRDKIAANVAGIALSQGGTGELNVSTDSSTISVTPSLNTLRITPGGVGSTQLGTNAVTTVKIEDNAVTTAKILDSNVTTAKIANGAVTREKIADTPFSQATFDSSISFTGTTSETTLYTRTLTVFANAVCVVNFMRLSTTSSTNNVKATYTAGGIGSLRIRLRLGSNTQELFVPGVASGTYEFPTQMVIQNTGSTNDYEIRLTAELDSAASLSIASSSASPIIYSVSIL